MVIMLIPLAITGRKPGRTSRTCRSNEVSHEPRCTRLRAMAAGCPQLSRFHHVRLQLFQAENNSRLANLWHIFCLHRGAVCRDVWLPVDPLSAVVMAADQISGSGHPVPRYRAPVVDLAGRKRRSALWRLAHCQLHLPDLWLLPAVRCVACSVPCATPACAGYQRALRTDSAPPVRGVCAHHAGLPAAVADTADLADVPDFAGHVRALGGH